MTISHEPGASHTNWAMIFDARSDSPQAAEALEQLVRRYWPAVYAYVRGAGSNVHESADLTQSFVCDVILSRQLFHRADPKRGRFRSLLLTALQNFLCERHRHETRGKRAPLTKPVQLDEATMARVDARQGITPEQAFSIQWHTTLILHVLERLKQECCSGGFAPHWNVFEARVVRPLLFGDKRVPYATLVERLNLKDSAQAANMMVMVKRRFVRTLIDEVASTVADPAQVEDELRALLHDVESHQ
jgi:DNA-directed RNA polymerase specialized sigma24 family protein